MFRRCCCNTFPGCTILSDDFTRADSTDIGSDWSEVTGDWSISSNAATVNATDGLLITTAARDTSYSSYIVQAILSDDARLVFDYLDSNNWHAAQWDLGAGLIRLYKCTGGTVTFVANLLTVAGSPSTVNVTLCIHGSTVILNYVSSVAKRTIVAHGGSKAGIGSVTGSVTISEFSFGYTSAENGACDYCTTDCTTCAENSETLPEYVVDLSNFAFTDGECDRCDEITGEFSVVFSTSIACRWAYSEDDYCYLGVGCNLATLNVEMGLVQFGGECRLFVLVNLNAVADPDDPCTTTQFTAQYRKAIADTSTYDMVNLNETLTLISNTQTGCTGSFPSTITVKSP